MLATVLPFAALGGGALWWNQRPHQPAVVAAAPQTSAASPEPSSSGASIPSASQTPTRSGETPIPSAIEVPGPGTVAAARAHLERLGFGCEKEVQPGMDSYACSHYTDHPAMMAYLGGATGHRLGRASLYVQDGPGGRHPTALALQQWLVSQVVVPTQRAGLLAELRAGTDQAYASTAYGPVVARGAGDGSVVLFVNGWVPDRAQPAELLPARPLAPALRERGYTCTGTAPVSCTRSQAGMEHHLEYTLDEYQVSHLALRSRSVGAVPVGRRAADEVQAVTGLFQHRATLRSWLGAHRDETAGATGFAGGHFVDWYPGSSDAPPSAASSAAPGGAGSPSVFQVDEPCWTDSLQFC